MKVEGVADASLDRGQGSRAAFLVDPRDGAEQRLVEHVVDRRLLVVGPLGMTVHVGALAGGLRHSRMLPAPGRAARAGAIVPAPGRFCPGGTVISEVR